MSDELKDEMKEILNSISLRGVADELQALVNPLIASRSQGMALLDLGSGIPKPKKRLIHQFHLILSKPPVIEAISNLSIRCCFCSAVISYPCWYYQVKYAINHFHYFVCFDGDKPNEVTARCFRR
jgi:hypothetical protein